MPSWRLLLTRPADESAVLAQQLAIAGIYTASLPLLAIEPLPESPALQAALLELHRYQALIVVSKPAARLVLAQLNKLGLSIPLQNWFAIGSATRAILENHGLKVHCALGEETSEALLALPALAAVLSGPNASALIIRGEGGRGLLGEHLRQRHVQVDYLKLYRRVTPEYPHAALANRVHAERLNGLMVSSGQGFQRLHELAANDWPRLASLPMFVPSQRVAEMAEAAGASRVVNCQGASAPALLAALHSFPSKHPEGGPS